MTKPTSVVQKFLCFPGKLVSWLVIPLALSIVLSVIAARQGWSVLIDWEGSVPLFGEALTVNSLVDLQWYIFSAIVLFGGIWAHLEDRHVTVDFVALGFSARTRTLISLFGNLFLLLPLCLLVMWFGSKFAMTAFATGEGSIQGGLTAHWLIKGALPVSFGLLGLAALLRAAQALRQLITKQYGDIHDATPTSGD
ncbi:Tripartite ATP-independent periplasmic transporters, DctQ component [Aquimixticola soesokkakensis]|uniref:TRAP transporter small permease protein n=1 Tax=Aquimixticola soesokkakensis TaxID=1519096 RepID=A0A1Y5T1R0_9RHOB|nr:TRAP transporter small permease subunit [Aquimixticola soesokkakensis]SLN54001.1 Tripartite ATP-independent periplasmic transporters, DctQ component [Aquimixticola soesokkakensis]